MNLLLFEWLIGGGLIYDQVDPREESILLGQGREMYLAVAEDLARVGFSIVSTVDYRIQLPGESVKQRNAVVQPEQLRRTLEKMADDADQILFIAPESDGRLLELCRWLSPWADKWICPDLDFVRLAADKTRTVEQLKSHSIPVCKGDLLGNLLLKKKIEQFSFPTVLKPNLGAGSEGVRVINDLSQLPNIVDVNQWRVEEFATGVPVSVSAFAGKRTTILTPTRQVFDIEPIGRYVKAKPLEAKTLQRRAMGLAARVVDALPATRGYFGIDIVLGESASDDVVIEVNPRLTMSYGLLRKIHPDLYSTFLDVTG